jgi:mannose-1-phosphate guanylyltransferase
VKVKTFTEKPDKDTAQAFIDSGEFLWNAGIFIWGAKVIAEEIEHCAPDIALHWQGWQEFVGSPYEQDFLARIYPDMPRISIDYAVMEKSDRVMAIPAFFDWTDLGNWESMYDYFAVRDSKGNAVRTGGKLLSRDNEGTIIFSSARDKLVAVKGLKDFMVVDMKDVLMICPRDEKSLADFLTELSLPEYEKYR